MVDVFISYAKEDRETARRLTNALEDQGWSVWWDQTIPPGGSWAEAIGRHLESATCAIALWSSSSVNSRWVLKEARLADQRNVLIPAFIELVEPPFDLSDVQSADLIGWTGQPSHGGADHLFDAVSIALGSTSNSSSGTRSHAPNERSVGKSAPITPSVNYDQNNRRLISEIVKLITSMMAVVIFFAAIGGIDSGDWKQPLVWYAIFGIFISTYILLTLIVWLKKHFSLSVRPEKS